MEKDILIANLYEILESIFLIALDTEDDSTYDDLKDLYNTLADLIEML